MRKYLMIVFIMFLGMSLYSYNEIINPMLENVRKQTLKYQGSETHRMHKQSKLNRDYQLGEEKTFWKWNLSIMPPSWVQVSATCRGVGEHSYLFVANDQWNVHMTQANVDSIMLYLETKTMTDNSLGAIEMDTLLFGAIPDELDNDPKLIVFYSALGSFNGSMFDGYFSDYNQVTEAEAQTMNPAGHSNECEMIYMTCYPLAPAEPIRISVLAHELQHLIHWGQDANEETWVNEGCSELAMVKFGLPDPITNFPSNPDNDLTSWNNQFSDYVKVMLFFTYMYEHCGGDDFIKRVVENPSNGITGIEESFLNVPPIPIFNTVFENWAIANYIDDQDINEGVYGYNLLDLPAFSPSANFPFYFDPIMFTATVSPWAVDYIRFTYEFEYTNYPYYLSILAELPLRSVLICYNADNSINEVMSPANNTYLFMADQQENKYFVACVINDSNQPISYEYHLWPEVSNEDIVTPSLKNIVLYPNPVRMNQDNISLKVKGTRDEKIKANLYNIKGQKVSEGMVMNGKDGEQSIQFNSKQLSSSIYFLKVQSKEQTVIRKISIIK